MPTKKQPKTVSETRSALARVSTSAVTTANGRVQLAARRMKWKPETLVRRIQEALPAPVEQYLYLDMGISFGIQPESLAKLLRYRLGSQELQPADIENHVIGKNIVANKFLDTMDFCENALGLVYRRTTDGGVVVSIEVAAKLASAYGSKAADVIDSVIENLGQIREQFRLKRMSDDRLIGMIITLIANKAEEGRLVLDAMELLEGPDELKLVMKGDTLYE